VAKPLAGKRILVTRRAEQAASLCAELAEQGAVPVLFPVTALVGLPCDGLLTVLVHPERYAWLIMTSVNAVDYLIECLDAGSSRVDLPPIAAVGTATARRLHEHGLEADFTPGQFTGEALAAELDVSPEQRVLLPRSRIGSQDIVDRFAARGVTVDDIALYDTVTVQPTAQQWAALGKGVEVITFASPSSVNSFVSIAASSELDWRSAKIACIGPSTADAVVACGLSADVVATRHTVEGLVHALVVFFGPAGDSS